MDISRAAVVRVREAGAAALHHSGFDPLPGRAGLWATVRLPALLRAAVDVGQQVVEQRCHSDRAFASVAAQSSECSPLCGQVHQEG
jgi:hypothetical protein